MTGGDDTLYDAYLEACLSGEPEDPESFLARHPDADSVVTAAIRAVYRKLRDKQAANQSLPFERLGDFRLLERLDAGGMGNVFLAEQESLGRVVALKVIRPELQGSPDAQERFDREAQAVAQLRHPNIVAVFGAGSDQGVRYLAMEMVAGRQLDDFLAAIAAGRETVPLARIVGWIAQLARALDYAHGRGIVHRDVKPANVRITPDDRALLLDFGVAHDMTADLTALTRSFTGSPTYAAPEQISIGKVDGRTDVYTLGVTLYQSLTGVVPFSADTVEGVFHRTLTEDPTPPRRLKQTVGRELEIVTLKAMEKDPAARYASAGAFADDLEAVLAFRPIRARPPGPVARLYKWARRRPATAVAIGAAATLLVVLATVLTVRRWSEARDLVAEARAGVTSYREQRENAKTLELQVDRLQRELHRRYFTPEDDQLLNARQADVANARRARIHTYHRVLELLRRAETLDSTVAGTDAVRAELYYEKWTEAKLARDLAAQIEFRELVQKHDTAGRFAGRFVQPAELTITSDPPGADCYLFRFRELREIYEGGERRMVPVPVGGGEPPVPYGTLVERVIRGVGDIAPNDLILRRDGDAAVVYQNGNTRTVTLPAGLEVRATATPVFLSPSSLVGQTPIGPLDLEDDIYFAVLRREGYEDILTPARPWKNVAVRLNPVGTTPPGFVFVVGYEETKDFWIMEREVTAGEYLEFLDAAETRALRGGRRILFPRDKEDDYWEPDADGRFELPDSWRADWPVLGVSWEDAQAYVRWVRRRDGKNYALPTELEWARAGGERGTFHLYPFGKVFRPKWANSNWARPRATAMPVMSFPVDQSVFGAFDMSGNAMEWLDASWHGDPNRFWVAGGSWGLSNPDLFRVPGGWGAPKDAPSGNYGFRMVLRREKK